MQGAEAICCTAVQAPQAGRVLGGEEAGLVVGDGGLGWVLRGQVLAVALGQGLVGVGGHGLREACMLLLMAGDVRCEALVLQDDAPTFSCVLLTC